MMLFHGALADAFGRRPVILVSLVIFGAASVGCALASDIHQLIFFRGMQGLSAGASMVVARALIRDRFAGHEAQRLMAQVSMMFGIAPVIAPIIGSWLHQLFGWRSIFTFLVLLSLILFVLSWRFVPETLAHHARQRLHPRYLLHNYAKVMRHRAFLLLSFVLALDFAGVFLYIASAPVFLLKHLSLNEHQFASLFISIVIGMVAGSYISGKIAGRFSIATTMRMSYLLQFTAALLNVVYCTWFLPSAPLAFVPLVIYCVGTYLAKPALVLLILDLFPYNRGLASSLQGFLQTMLSSIVAGVISPWLAKSLLALAWGMLVMLTLGWAAWTLYTKLEPLPVNDRAEHCKP